MFWSVLAQTGAADADKAVGILERLTKGGVPLICLAVALLAVVGLVLQYRGNAALEQKYREDLEGRAKQAKDDADKRLADAKQEAKERAADIEKLNDKLRQEQKDSDAALAAAVRALENNAKLFERIEKKLG